MLDDFPSLQAQRDAFRAAAERDVEATRRPRKRRMRRAAIAAAAGVLGVGGAAAATELIAVGQPEQDFGARSAKQLPVQRYVVTMTAADTPLRWGVGIYASADGRSCAIAGQLRGTSLGLIRDGTFRPFAPDTVGACRDHGSRAAATDQRVIGDRFLVFGLAPRRTRSVQLAEVGGSTRTVTTGSSGSFLFVYDRTTRSEDFRALTFFDAAGRRLP